MVGRTMARLGGQQPSGGTMDDGLEREVVCGFLSAVTMSPTF